MFDKLFKKKPVIALIAALIVVAAAVLIPKLTGKPLSELFGGTDADQSQEVSASPSEVSSQELSSPDGQTSATDSAASIAEDGSYTSKDDVALYIHTYGRLPGNFITKDQAEALGWESGSLRDYAPGKSIGGDVFGNREGLLPKKSGRVWYECDIDYDGGKRNAKRIVFSNDGLIYYTEDHYESFTQLY